MLITSIKVHVMSRCSCNERGYQCWAPCDFPKYRRRILTVEAETGNESTAQRGGERLFVFTAGLMKESRTHPDEQLRHHDISQLTGGVQGGTRRQVGPGWLTIDLLLGAVGQKEQQSGKISLGHRRQQPRWHAALWRRGPRGQPEGRHERPLFILGADPRLPLLPVKQTQTGSSSRLHTET